MDGDMSVRPQPAVIVSFHPNSPHKFFLCWLRFLQVVDTLWLWVLSNEAILSFAPEREPDDTEDDDLASQADLRSNVLNAIEGGTDISDCFDLAALIVYHCVTSLLHVVYNAPIFMIVS